MEMIKTSDVKREKQSENDDDKTKSENGAFALIFALFRDPGGILTPNRWSRNPVRYTVAPQSQFGNVKLAFFRKK